MKSSLTSLKFIFKHTLEYWRSIIIVVVFIIAATWLNVQTPMILANAIDKMVGTQVETKIPNVDSAEQCAALEVDGTTTRYELSDNSCYQETMELGYVTAQIKYDSIHKMYDQLESGAGLSSDMINQIAASGALDQQAIDKLSNSTSQQQTQIYNLYKVIVQAALLDVDNTLNNLPYTDAQNQFIMSSDLPDQMKFVALSQQPDQVLNLYNLYENLLITQSEVDSYHKSFVNVILILVAAYILMAFTNFIYQFMMAIIAGKSTSKMRKGLFGKIEKLSIRFFDQSNDGDLLSRFTNDIDNISNAMNQSFIQIISQAAMLIGIIWMMILEDDSSMIIFKDTSFEFVLNNVMVWSMLGFAVLAVGLAAIVIKKAQFYVSRQQTKLGDLNGYIDERISGQKIVISYGLENETIKDFEEYNEAYRDTAVKGQVYSGILMPLMNGIGLVNLGALVFMGAIFVSNGVMSVGLLVAFINYSQRFFQPLAQMVSQYNMVELAMSGGTRVKSVMDEESEIINHPNAVDIDGINGKVELRDVSFGYYEDKPVLKNIDIKVEKGQMIALVGPTGSGKTTVMNLMNRFYDIDSGAILFDDKDIREITLDTLRKNVGIVLQESVLFSGTIGENIAYGKLDATQADIEDAAKTANIHDFIMSLEDGYETKVDNSTSVFSTGQKQLMSIARTIITDPDLLILDEATSNVDTVTEARIQKAMENVLHGRTSFVIAHRLKTILNADEIIVLKDGEIIEKGPHHDLLKQDGFYAELYYNQFVVE